jgi:hypothetical protein
MAQDDTKEQKVFRLVQDLEQVRKNKKAEMQAYNEEIKRINGEIKDLLNEK